MKFSSSAVKLRIVSRFVDYPIIADVTGERGAVLKNANAKTDLSVRLKPTRVFQAVNVHCLNVMVVIRRLRIVQRHAETIVTRALCALSNVQLVVSA